MFKFLKRLFKRNDLEHIRRLLTKFYYDWNHQAELSTTDSSCHDESSWFESCHGLCANLDRWCEYNYARSGILRHELNSLMKHDFETEGLDRVYPFNSDELDYLLEFVAPSNPKRRQFVRDRIEQYKHLISV